MVTTMEKTAEVLGAPDALKKNLDWYIANQKELAAKYDGKILLIVNQQLIGVFDSMSGAYAEAVKSHEPSTFTLQPCSPDRDSFTVMLYSPYVLA